MIANIECETALVATAIAAPNFWHEINYVTEEDFTDETCATLWGKIGQLVNEGRRPDLNVTLSEVYASVDDQKAARQIVGEWIASLVSTSNGPEYARVVKDLSGRRKIIETAKELSEKAGDTSCGYTAAEIASQGISGLSHGQLDGLEFVPAHEIGKQIVESLETVCPCYSTGFPRMDSAIGGGFYKGKFYGLGARMKSGKSLLMSSIAYNMTITGRARVLYLCLEMGAHESFQRVLAMHMGINALQFLKHEIRSAPWFKQRIQEANDAFQKTGCLVFRSRPRMTLEDLRATIAKAGMSGKYDGVIVDYMQLVEGKASKQSSSEHYDNVAQTLAEAVKRYPMWILSAAQLNRDGNIRGSDGLLMACDAAFNINKKEGEYFYDGTKNHDKAWLEMTVSRYTPYADLGSEEVPAYEIDPTRGPMFVELK